MGWAHMIIYITACLLISYRISTADVIEAIAKYAFENSPFPVVLRYVRMWHVLILPLHFVSGRPSSTVYMDHNHTDDGKMQCCMLHSLMDRSFNYTGQPNMHLACYSNSAQIRLHLRHHLQNTLKWQHWESLQLGAAAKNGLSHEIHLQVNASHAAQWRVWATIPRGSQGKNYLERYRVLDLRNPSSLSYPIITSEWYNDCICLIHRLSTSTRYVLFVRCHNILPIIFHLFFDFFCDTRIFIYFPFHVTASLSHICR